MAWNTLRDGQTFWEAEGKAKVSAIRVIINGALLNVLNPKLSLFFLAFLPQFVSAEFACSTVMLVWLAHVFMGLTFIIFVVYGACASLAQTYALSDRWQQLSPRAFKFRLGISFFQFPPLPRPRRHRWQRARHLPRPAHPLPCGSGSS